MRRRTVGRGVRAGMLVTAAVSIGVLQAPPAGAHPFGPPPTALVSASGHRVLVEWGAASDDAMIIGMSIGVLDDGSLERYLEGPVQTAPPASKEEELSASPKLRDYLLDHIGVAQEGSPCEGTVEPIGNFMAEGARVVYECPRPVDVVDLRITMLHDVHDAYRTFAVTEGGGQPAQSAFTVQSPVQRWDFSATSPAAGDQPWLPSLALSALGAGAAGAIGVLVWRRRSGARSWA